MKDKNGKLINVGDWVWHTRPFIKWQDISELGKVFECHDGRVYMEIRGGCFCEMDPEMIEILDDEKTMLRMLER